MDGRAEGFNDPSIEAEAAKFNNRNNPNEKNISLVDDGDEERPSPEQEKRYEKILLDLQVLYNRIKSEYDALKSPKKDGTYYHIPKELQEDLFNRISHLHEDVKDGGNINYKIYNASKDTIDESLQMFYDDHKKLGDMIYEVIKQNRQ